MKVLVIFFLFALTLNSNAQSPGDYRSTSSGSWNNILNWERFNGLIWLLPLSAPSNGDGTITIRNTHNIDANTNLTADQIVINSGGTLTVSATVTIANGTGTDLTCNGTIILTGTSGGTGTSMINGTMNWTGGIVNSNINVSAAGTLNISSGSAKAINNTITNNGSINWSGGVLNFNNGTLNNSGTLTNSFDGTVNSTSGTNLINNSGTFIKSSGAGTTAIQTPVTNTGEFKGTGTINFTGTFTNNGIIGPGVTEGILTVNSSGSPILTSSSSLKIEMLDGSGAGTGHDQLVRNSNLTLIGSLDVLELGTIPEGSYTIISLTSGSITGSFSSVNIPAGYIVIVGSTDVILTKSVLPVKLLKFEGRLNNNKTDLFWEIESEENLSYFNIERSIDGISFSSIGKVSHQINMVSPKNYIFSYQQTGKNNYYRLKMTDNDGKFEYSKVIKISSEEITSVRLFPNPSNGKLFITSSQEWLHSGITIFNNSGQSIFQGSVENTFFEINLKHYSEGIYWIFFRKNNETVTKRILFTTK